MLWGQIPSATADDLGRGIVLVAACLLIFSALSQFLLNLRQLYLSWSPVPEGTVSRQDFVELKAYTHQSVHDLRDIMQPLLSEQAVYRKDIKALEKLQDSLESLVLRSAAKEGALERQQETMERLESEVQKLNETVRKIMRGFGRRMKRTGERLKRLERDRGADPEG